MRLTTAKVPKKCQELRVGMDGFGKVVEKHDPPSTKMHLIVFELPNCDENE